LGSGSPSPVPKVSAAAGNTSQARKTARIRVFDFTEIVFRRQNKWV